MLEWSFLVQCCHVILQFKITQWVLYLWVNPNWPVSPAWPFRTGPLAPFSASPHHSQSYGNTKIHKQFPKYTMIFFFLSFAHSWSSSLPMPTLHVLLENHPFFRSGSSATSSETCTWGPPEGELVTPVWWSQVRNSYSVITLDMLWSDLSPWPSLFLWSPKGRNCMLLLYEQHLAQGQAHSAGPNKGSSRWIVTRSHSLRAAPGSATCQRFHLSKL